MTCKYLFLLLLICISMSATGQEKFIEVTVSDTILAKANQFVYTIVTSPVYEDDGDTSAYALSYQKRNMMRSEQQKRMTDSLKSVLQHKGFSLLPENAENKFVMYAESRFYSLQVQTSSLDSVQLLFNLIKTSPAFAGAITRRWATDDEGYYKKLVQRIIAKAKEKAARIAALSGLTPGDILSVKEIVKEDDNEGWTAYPPLSALGASTVPGWHTTIYPAGRADAKTSDDFYPLKNTLTIRFSVK